LGEGLACEVAEEALSLSSSASLETGWKWGSMWLFVSGNGIGKISNSFGKSDGKVMGSCVWVYPSNARDTFFEFIVKLEVAVV
jgi:hypothetical protein